MTTNAQIKAYMDAQQATLDAGFAAIQSRLDGIEAKIAALPPVIEPPPVEPPPVPEPVPPPVEPPPMPDPAPAPGQYAWTRTRGLTDATLPAVIHAPGDLVAGRLVPPITSAVRSKPLVYAGDWLGAVAFSGGIEAALINDKSGEWLAGGDAHSMLAFAEGASALPNHWVNPDTGRLWSIVETPKVSVYSKTATITLPEGATLSPIKEDSAHYVESCFVAYLATLDRWYLQELQFQANYHQLQQNPGYRQNDTGLFTKGQARAWAWGLRDTVAAYLATPDGDVPAPLLPKSYWKRIIDNNRDDFARWMDPAQNPLAACHFARMLNGSNIAPWQQDWIGAIMGWMLWTGQFDDWRANYEWQIKQALIRTLPDSGFPRSQALGYWWSTIGVTDIASLVSVNGLVETADGLIDPAAHPSSFVSYGESLRANLKLAMLNGIPRADEGFAYIDAALAGRVLAPRWSL